MTAPARRREPPDGVALDELDDWTEGELVEERDFLLRSLGDLDAERGAGDVDDHDYEVLRDGYTARAAAVLRALDRRSVADDVSPGPVAVPRRRRGRVWRAPAVVALVAAFAVAAGLLVAHGAGQRLPGDTVSGSTPNDKNQQLLTLAANDVQKHDLVGAVQTYDKVLSSDPRNLDALANEGWLLRVVGDQTKPPDTQLIERGLAEIRMAEQVDPSYADAHFFAGMTLLQDEHDPKGAVTEFELFLADNPPADMAGLVKAQLQVAQAEAAGQLPANASPGG
jgi:tetratricopeptide (TPR) repeat protein